MPRIPPFTGKGASSAAVVGAFLAASALASPLAAEQPLRISPPVGDAGARDPKAAREQELEKLQATQRQAEENEARLKAEIEAIGQDQRQLSRSLIETAARLRQVETRIADSEARLATLDASERTMRETLRTRHATIAELLAALQRIGRHPPPALMVSPEDALGAVRSAIMLGAVLPGMRAEAEALATELASLVRVRREIATERAQLDSDLAALAGERRRMALLVEERQKRQSEAEKALESERQRLQRLARQTQDLKELIAKLEQEAEKRREEERRAARMPPRDPQRLGPAVAFAEAKGKLRFPVNGVRIREFGAPDQLGNAHRGLSLATRDGAQVTAPSDAWVVYAGPFRSYGQLLILNAGGGYHILLAGMERISVDLGQFVLTGEPVATMGGGAKAASALAIGSRQPVLYIEFRKDGTPVDPGPWWAVTDSEKVRG